MPGPLTPNSPIASEPAKPIAASRPTSAADSRREDDACIDAALAGDASAYGRLVQKHQDRLYNSLLRYTGNADDALDIAQEAFTQAYLKLNTFKRNSAFFTWLYRIAFNRAASAARKRRERTSLDGMTDAGAAGPTDPLETPDNQMLAQERVALVRTAVQELADDYRRVVVLREFDGLDYQQIAEVLEIPVGTVRSRLFRARMQMKDRLAAVLDASPTTTE